MSKNDDELNEFMDEVTDGVYNPTFVEVIFKFVKQMKAWGDDSNSSTETFKFFDEGRNEYQITDLW